MTYNANTSRILRFFAGQQVLVDFIFYVVHNLGNASSNLISSRFKEFLVLGIVDLTALNAATLESGAKEVSCCELSECASAWLFLSLTKVGLLASDELLLGLKKSVIGLCITLSESRRC